MTWPRAGLLLALALLAAQALPANWATPLEIDEQITHYLAAGRTPPSVWRRCQEQSATPPLHFWLTRASLGLPFGTLEFRLRLPALLATAAGLFFAWRIGERFLGRGSGAAAALLLAIMPMVVRQMAEQSRPYALGFVLTLAGLDAALRLRSFAWRRSDALLFAGCCLALPWTHYFFALTVPALLLAGLIARDPDLDVARTVDQPLPRRWLVAIGLLSGIAALPLLPGALRVQSLEKALRWHTTPPSPTDWESQFGLPVWVAYGSICGFVCLAISGGWSRTRLALALACGLLPAFALNVAGRVWESPVLLQTRYASTGIGVMAVALCLGFCPWRRGGRLVLTVGLVALSCWQQGSGLRKRFEAPVWHDTEWKTAAQLIAAEAGPHDLALCYTGVVETRLAPMNFADAGFQEYCTSRLGTAYLPGEFPRLALPYAWSPGADGFEWQAHYAASAKKSLAGGGAVWLVVSADTDLGMEAEAAAVAWLKSLGFAPVPVRDNSIARVWRAPPAMR